MTSWTVTRYRGNGWQVVYRGGEDASHATFKMMAGTMGIGYLRLINPSGQIVACVGRMDSLEKAIAALNEPVFFKVDD
jgi:hypothetical protein